MKLEFIINPDYPDRSNFRLATVEDYEPDCSELENIARHIESRLNWKVLSVQNSFLPGPVIQFERRENGTFLTMSSIDMLGFKISSNSREILETIKPLLEEFFSRIS